jgi:hypothetical protein
VRCSSPPICSASRSLAAILWLRRWDQYSCAGAPRPSRYSRSSAARRASLCAQPVRAGGAS